MSTVPQVHAAPHRLRRWRRWCDPGLSVVGILVILGAVLFSHDVYAQLLLTTGGLCLMEAGVWRLAQRLLPSERQYHGLHAEVDRFLHLIRQLNAAALVLKEHDTPETHQVFTELHQAMQQSMARMATLAGQTDADLAAAQAPRPAPEVV